MARADHDPRQLQRIAAALRELQRTSPKDAAGLAAWTAEAVRFSEGLEVTLPLQVMHYLHDADLRLRDRAYRERQDRDLDAVIVALEGGRIPASAGVTASVRLHCGSARRWRG